MRRGSRHIGTPPTASPREAGNANRVVERGLVLPCNHGIAYVAGTIDSFCD